MEGKHGRGQGVGSQEDQRGRGRRHQERGDGHDRQSTPPNRHRPRRVGATPGCLHHHGILRAGVTFGCPRAC